MLVAQARTRVYTDNVQKQILLPDTGKSIQNTHVIVQNVNTKKNN